MSSAPAPKFRRRAEARPDELLDAALAVFTEKGFAGARMEDIAARAGLSKGAVYLYFPSKLALFEALIRRAVQPLTDGALTGIAEHAEDPIEALVAVLRSIGAALSRPGAMAVPKLILREAPAAPEVAAFYRQAVMDRVMPVVIGLLRRGVAEGRIRPVDPELTLRSIMGPVILHLLLDEVFGVRPTEGQDMQALVENHLSILLAGLDPGRGTA